MSHLLPQYGDGLVPARNIYHDAVVHAFLMETEPERLLYLAVPHRVYEGLLTERFGLLIVARLQLRLLVFDEQQARVIQWIG